MVPSPYLRGVGQLARLITLAVSRQNDCELGELPGPCIDVDPAAMLFHDDIVAHRQAKPGTFARRLGGKERIEYLFFYLLRNAGAVVANANLDAVTEVSGRRGKGWLVAVPHLCFPFHDCIDTIRNQVEKNSGDLLREQINHPGGRIKGSFQPDVELAILGPRTMVSKIQAVFDDRVKVDRPAFTGTFARMQQHILDDGVRALAMLDYLFKIAL